MKYCPDCANRALESEVERLREQRERLCEERDQAMEGATSRAMLLSAYRAAVEELRELASAADYEVEPLQLHMDAILYKLPATKGHACDPLEKQLDEANGKFMHLLSLAYELKNAERLLHTTVSLDYKVRDIAEQMLSILAGQKDEKEI